MVMGQRTIGFGTQKAPTRRKVIPTSVTTTDNPQLALDAKNREAVRIKVRGISVNGVSNIKLSPARKRCGSGRANVGGGMLADSRHQIPIIHRTAPERSAHTA